MRRVKFLSLLAVLVLLFTACAPPAPTGGQPAANASGSTAAGGAPKMGGTLTVGLNGEIDTIDPHKSVKA